MVHSSEAYMPLDLDQSDIKTQKEFMEKVKPIVSAITPIVRSNKTNLFQNTVNITPETFQNVREREFTVSIEKNGVKADKYDYGIIMRTSKNNIPIYIYIEGKIPTEKGPAEISEAGVITEKGTNSAKILSVGMLRNTTIPFVKDSLGDNRTDILDATYSHIDSVIESLNSGRYTTSFEPKEGGVDQITGGLKEPPDNLN